MKFVTNSETGREEAFFQATVTSIGPSMKNSNDKPYMVCSIQFKDAKNNNQITSCLVYSNQYPNLEEKQVIDCVAIFTPERTDSKVLITSRLAAAQRATVDMFGFNVKTEEVGVNAG